jgi:hypothetical protein
MNDWLSRYVSYLFSHPHVECLLSSQWRYAADGPFYIVLAPITSTRRIPILQLLYDAGARLWRVFNLPEGMVSITVGFRKEEERDDFMGRYK